MDNWFDMYEPSLLFTRYDDSPYSCADKLMRDCLQGISAEQLNDRLIGFQKQLSKYAIVSREFVPIVFNILSAILIHRNDAQGVNIVSEFVKNQKNCGSGAFFQMYCISYDLSSCSLMSLMFMLTLFVLRKTDDELCKRLIDRWISINADEYHGWPNEVDKVTHIEFIVSPIYPLMITENYELIKYFLEQIAKVRELSPNDVKNTIYLEGYVESAVHYRQKDFLRLIYDRGFDFSNNMPLLTYIYSQQEHFDFISQFWNVQREIAPKEEQNKSENGERQICIPRNKQLAFLLKMCMNYGRAGCDEVFRYIPFFKTIDEEDLTCVTSGYCAIEYEDCNDLTLGKPHNRINYNVNIITLLDNYLADDITIIAYNGRIDSFLPFLPRKKITFDMRSCGKDMDYFGLRSPSVKSMQSLLKSCDILFNTEELSFFHIELLSRNSAPLTKLMIQKGAFSDENLGDTVAYLVRNKLYNCLAELNKTYLKEAIV